MAPGKWGPAMEVSSCWAVVAWNVSVDYRKGDVAEQGPL
jgi:hypothetical protein